VIGSLLPATGGIYRQVSVDIRGAVSSPWQKSITTGDAGENAYSITGNKHFTSLVE
jgi:hypothetical protein